MAKINALTGSRAISAGVFEEVSFQLDLKKVGFFLKTSKKKRLSVA